MSHMFRVGIQSFALILAVIVIFMSWKDEQRKLRFNFYRLFDVRNIHSRSIVRRISLLEMG